MMLHFWRRASRCSARYYWQHLRLAVNSPFLVARPVRFCCCRNAARKREKPKIHRKTSGFSLAALLRSNNQMVTSQNVQPRAKKIKKPLVQGNISDAVFFDHNPSTFDATHLEHFLPPNSGWNVRRRAATKVQHCYEKTARYSRLENRMSVCYTFF